MASALEEANYQGAVFEEAKHFVGVHFGNANFRGATFKGPVSFAGAHFHERVRFDSATFEGTASFKNAVFENEAIFALPEGEEEVPEWPEEVTFRRWADFRQATFNSIADFGGARFESRSRFSSTRFDSDAVFTGATFTRARTIGPTNVAGKLDLDRVAFGAPVRIRVAAGEVSCEGTQFQSLTTIDLLQECDLSLREAAFAEPSTVTGHPSGPRPRLVRLGQANVAHLTLTEVDVRDCSFLSVHNLDALRFEGTIDFHVEKRPFRTRRLQIFDEVELREGRAPESDAAGLRKRAEGIARAYRALRKGSEDTSDSPGAADFYYGEMEMRRRSARGPEHAILALYWLVSGYGLRASRSLAALALTVVLFAWGFQAWGFDPDQGFWKSLLFSAESTSSLFRAPDPPGGSELTDAGHVLQMCLRLLGPLFFGLALLALRGRVKR